MHEFRGLSSRWKTPLLGFICVCRCIFGGLCCPFYFYFCIKYFHISNNLESPCFPVPVCLLFLRAGLSASESPSLVFSGSICNCPCVYLLSPLLHWPLLCLSPSCVSVFLVLCICLCVPPGQPLGAPSLHLSPLSPFWSWTLGWRILPPATDPPTNLHPSPPSRRKVSQQHPLNLGPLTQCCQGN